MKPIHEMLDKQGEGITQKSPYNHTTFVNFASSIIMKWHEMLLKLSNLAKSFAKWHPWPGGDDEFSLSSDLGQRRGDDDLLCEAFIHQILSSREM